MTMTLHGSCPSVMKSWNPLQTWIPRRVSPKARSKEEEALERVRHQP